MLRGAAVERIAQSARRRGGPVRAADRRCAGYLREAETSEELRRLGILQSRVVLGWEGWREVASKYGLAVTRALLAAAMDAGAIKQRDLTTLSHVVLAALWEGATLIATAEDRAAVRADAEAVVLDIIEGLRAPP